MNEHVISAGFQLNYAVYGDPNAQHTIIFSHGNGNSLSDWVGLGYVEKMSSHYRMILVDALGHGKSDKPEDPEEYTPERRALDVISVLDALGVNTAHFFGNSIGGSLGFVLADLYPDRFLSFMIGSAHPYGSSQLTGCNLFPKEFRNQLLIDGTERFVTNVEENFLHRRFHAGVRAAYLQNDPRALNAANAPVWPDRTSCLQNIKVPVLLFGGQLDPVTDSFLNIRQKISCCEVEILPNTDHCDAYWDSEKIVPLVNNFIDCYFPSLGAKCNP